MNDENPRLSTMRHLKTFMEMAPTDAFNNLTQLACAIAGSSIAIVNYSMTPKVWYKVRDKQYMLNDLMLGSAFQSMASVCHGGMYIVPDVAQEPLLKEHIFLRQHPETVTYICLPIRTTEGKVIGLVHLLADKKLDLSGDQLKGLQILAKATTERLLAEIYAAMSKAKMEADFEKQKEFLDAVLENLNDGVVACNHLGEMTLTDTCPVGISAFNLDHEFTIWNPWNEKIFGFNQAEAHARFGGHPDSMSSAHIEQVKKVHEIMEIVRQTGTSYTCDMQVFRKDSTQGEISLTMLPMYNENKELNGFLTVVNDISDLKLREKNLMESLRALREASVAKSEFLATMSHEIRTPLNGVIGMTDLVLMSDLQPEQRHQLQVAQSSAHNLLAILSDILDFSKIEARKMDLEKVSFDFGKMVSEIYETLRMPAEAKGLQLVHKMEGPDAPLFVGDPGRIRQVLLNLISNAIKFSNNGEVTTTVQFNRAQNGLSNLRVEVRDFGVGIKPEVLEKLFTAFTQADSSTTRKFGGTGLGLSISKGLIELMNGEIGVESTLGQGSTFWFTLHLERPQNFTLPVEVETLVPPPAVVQQEQLRILLAEDNLVNQKIALGMLAKLGYKADVVEHGKAAIDALRSRDYDIILMDCQMPEMDGYEATRIIRQEEGLPNQIPIIAVTANAMKGDREKCLDAGMSDYLSKPVQLAGIREVILRQLTTPPLNKKMA